VKITKQDLRWAAEQQVITVEQADSLWTALDTRTEGRARFDATHVAYYCGAFIVISAMGWFLTEAWDLLGGVGVAAIALIYGIAFAAAGKYLGDQKLRVASGLLFTLAVWMTPLVVYGIERAARLWPDEDPGTFSNYHVWVRGGWIVMELVTIIIGAIVLRLRRFPFITFPIAFALWYMSMDLTPLITRTQNFTFEERAWVSVVFGALMLVAAWVIDLRRFADDYAFWCYLFGLMAFWGGLSAMDSNSELSKFIYLLINVALIALSLFLRRRVFLVFGACGAFGYLGHLAWEVFKDSIIFPFVLTLGGLLVIGAGIAWQKKRMQVEAWFQSRIPDGIRRLVPPER
jgi:hypothetical protein